MTSSTTMQAVYAEKTLLGCAVADSNALYQILPVLRAEDFSLDSHRRIFHAIRELADSGKSVDDLTLADHLGNKSQLESVGGAAYISALSDGVVIGSAKVTNVEHYAEIVLDKSRRRQAYYAASALLARAEDPHCSTDDVLADFQEQILRIQGTFTKGVARPIKDIVSKVLDELQTQSQHDGLIGFPTGLDSLDLATGGIRPGELWTIGALPGRGKTALGVQILLANGKASSPCCGFSLEMQSSEIGRRFLAARSAVSSLQLRNPRSIGKDRWVELGEAAARIAGWPIYVDDRSTLKIGELLASARLYIRRHGVKLIVVDYLRLVDAPGRDLRERISCVADSLRQLAKTERIAVVLLSQLRRPEGGVNARPTMLDLKESGDIEAHSHVVLLPYLPVADDGKPIPEEQMLIIGKNRNGGIGSLPVYFDEKRLQFAERTT